MNGPRRFKDLPLFWKFLLPSLALLVAVGAVGTFAVVRDLSDRAQSNVDQQLSARSVDARATLRDRELYLLESVNFASNVRGMDQALAQRDRSRAATLLRSVLALKSDLSLLVATDIDGRGVAELVFPTSRPPHVTAARTWASEAFVADALGSTTGERTSGFIRIDGHSVLAIAGPVCASATACEPTGVAIAGFDVQTLAAATMDRLAGDARVAPTNVSIYGTDGRLLGGAGRGSSSRPTADALHGREERMIRGDTETLFVPLDVEQRPAGVMAVTVARAPAFAAVHSTGTRLALIVLAAMVGLVGLMAVLSRRILVQVRPLVDANRAFGEGDLAARVPVKSRDELGELALGVNKMAAQLQASYETLEARVVERTEEVRRLLEQRTEFFTSLSHDFRTPLAVILSEANMLEDARQRLSLGEVKDSGAALRQSAEHLLNAINQILDLAQSDAGIIDVELEAVGIGEVIKELRPTIEGLGKSSHLRVSVDVPRGLSKVVADRTRLKEVVLNLVENAAKYTPEGGTVDISARPHNGAVRLCVADSGIGIPRDIGERVFEPFYRVPGSKPVRGQASNGLGLALAKRFVEAQGGTISFESRPEGGTVFTVALPRAGA